MAEIDGKPMIQHVWDRASAAALGPVAVATDSVEIAAVVNAFGGRAVLTSRSHACGTDRIGEALATLDPDGRCDVIINFQGDTPFLPEGAAAAALALLTDPQVDIGTLATTASPIEADDANAVKLVGTHIDSSRLRALYFTRARAPFGEGPLHKHIGVYAFWRRAFVRFISLPPSPLEQREGLEQLRALEAGMRIDAALLDKTAISVDTEQDLAVLRAATREQERP